MTVELRGEKGNAIKAAFERAGVGAVYREYPTVNHSWVSAFINPSSGWHSLGPGWQRQALVIIEDQQCSVTLSHLYQLPKGKGANDLARLELPISVLRLPIDADDLAETIVNAVRQASLENTATTEVELKTPPPPPVPLSHLNTLADLIEVSEKFYPEDAYQAFLMKVLKKTGKVLYKGEEWFLDHGGLICHSETAPGSAIVRGPDGEPVIYTNAAYIKLDTFRE